MSLNTTTGRYICDRCGRDVGNGSIHESAAVRDLAADGVTPVRRDLCHTYPDPARPGKKIKGCAERVFTVAALRHLHRKDNP